MAAPAFAAATPPSLGWTHFGLSGGPGCTASAAAARAVPAAADHSRLRCSGSAAFATALAALAAARGPRLRAGRGQSARGWVGTT
eukprot:CAMPEP_0203853308 /NCGR_PEP_ID=MMETSP0359-20131031/8456_1 /ASSEMBLY_ACC=CAM_ASM_000338 /TAXON_ID=268821 /ORGANISM="Scrippsiella Hangoei, Strain SHTV-5" /LENGTH=84 /DNA_ID=CAMNT_0050769641 /DNA_START=24 /DNA_END=274 /DNA_ORIENTATION=-